MIENNKVLDETFKIISSTENVVTYETSIININKQLQSYILSNEWQAELVKIGRRVWDGRTDIYRPVMKGLEILSEEDQLQDIANLTN